MGRVRQNNLNQAKDELPLRCRDWVPGVPRTDWEEPWRETLAVPGVRTECIEPTRDVGVDTLGDSLLRRETVVCDGRRAVVGTAGVAAVDGATRRILEPIEMAAGDGDEVGFGEGLEGGGEDVGDFAGADDGGFQFLHDWLSYEVNEERWPQRHRDTEGAQRMTGAW